MIVGTARAALGGVEDGGGALVTLVVIDAWPSAGIGLGTVLLAPALVASGPVAGAVTTTVTDALAPTGRVPTAV